MNPTTATTQKFLVTWYHPVEAHLSRNDDTWVVSRNDDFGYEVVSALVRGEDELVVKESIRIRYGNAPINVVFRSCTPHPVMKTFLHRARKPSAYGRRWFDAETLLSA